MVEYFDRISDNLDILDALDLHDCEFPRRSSTPVNLFIVEIINNAGGRAKL